LNRHTQALHPRLLKMKTFIILALACLAAGQEEEAPAPVEAAPVEAAPPVPPPSPADPIPAPAPADASARDIFEGYVLSDGYLEVLGREPDRSFDCDGRPYGYYADVANDCRIFHVCNPLEDDAGEVVETQQYSFFCGNQTVFSQDSLTCAHEGDSFPCEESESLYDAVNALFGQKEALFNEEE